MTAGDAARAEFVTLSDALESIRREHFERHRHPAVLLDQATTSSVRVWGWWTTVDPALPCILWCSDRGWFATVVGPEEAGEPGYELCYWSHRRKLLDLALANAIGPHPSAGLLELHLVLGRYPSATREALLWGIVRLRTAHQRAGRVAASRHHDARFTGGRVDRELAIHSLIPMIFKKRASERSPLPAPPRTGQSEFGQPDTPS